MPFLKTNLSSQGDLERIAMLGYLGSLSNDEIDAKV